MPGGIHGRPLGARPPRLPCLAEELAARLGLQTLLSLVSGREENWHMRVLAGRASLGFFSLIASVNHCVSPPGLVAAAARHGVGHGGGGQPGSAAEGDLGEGTLTWSYLCTHTRRRVVCLWQHADMYELPVA